MAKKAQKLTQNQKEAVSDALADFFFELFEKRQNGDHYIAEPESGFVGNTSISDSAT